MKMEIDKLQKVGIRDVWPIEPTHFTPWLSDQENIVMIGELIGWDLQDIRSEHKVGIYDADILCEDLGTNEKVVIENQYSKTDHRHLGQLITYAAGIGASTVIWISESFGEEHRAALDWLNENTNEHLEFYGIEIELYRIGDSLPAPKFNMVSKTNDWSRNIRRSAENSDLTETRQLQQEYWSALKVLWKLVN